MTLITLLAAALRLLGLDRVPPGLHFDEAVYGLMALDIYHGATPVFFPAYTGREPLYMYVMAGVFRLVGVNAYGIRLTSALLGLLTVVLVYALGRVLFSRRVGLLAAAVLAVLYWHLTVSRNGYPNILIPPLECLALLLLWKGYRDGRPWQLALGGVFVGGVLYTYLAARFFPITVALIFLYALLVDTRRGRKRLPGLLLAALVALLVFAPLGSYFLSHPHDFMERAGQVLVFKQAPDQVLRVIGNNLLQTAGAFFVRGDPRQHYNLPGKPIFDPLMALFFLLGLGVTFRRWRRPEYALLPLWVIGMSLPALLTVDLMPQSQRMFGITPALALLAALGLETVMRQTSNVTGLVSRLTFHVSRFTSYAITVFLLFETAATAVTYFGNWGRQTATYYTFHTDYTQLAARAVAELDAGRAVVFQTRYYKHPTAVFTAPRTLETIWVAGNQNLALPNRAPAEVRYLWPTHDIPPAPALEPLMTRLLEPVDQWLAPDGSIAAVIYRLKPAAVAQEAATPVQATFSDEVAALDWTLPATAPRDQPLQLLVHWRVLRPVAEGRTFTLHLVDENGVLWAQGGEMGYLSEQWRAGDTVYQLFTLALPPGLPAGPYQARLILGREASGILPVYQNGQLVATALTLGTVTLTPEGARIEPPIAGVAFGNVFTATVETPQRGVSTAVPGGQVQIPFTWQAALRPPQNYTTTVTLADTAGAVAQQYEFPLAYQYPTTAWQPGEVVQTVYVLPLRGVASGDYQVTLRVTGLPGTLDLGRLALTGGERLFTVPPLQQPLSATVGSEIAFLGYDLDTAQVKPGATFALRLVWQALATPAGDYKVFVHLVGPDGQTWGQDDSVPAGWQRPTLGWEAGEVIVDEHTVPVKPDAPAGSYTLYVGLYDATTFVRLELHGATGQRLADDRLPLTTITLTP